MSVLSSAPARIAVFVLGLGVVLVAGLGVGAAVGPLDTEPEESSHGHDGGADPAHAEDHAASATETEPTVAGLQVSQGGHTLVLAEPQTAPGRHTLRFVVSGPDGAPVTAYDEQHEKDLHLIAVRRDLTGFQHVHPELGADGTWSVPLDLTPGAWRVLADFKPTGGDALVLGTDLLVSGRSAPADLGPDNRRARTHGYDVALAGDLVAGQGTELALTVTRDGAPVTDLEPYLGAHGHLVVLRAGDLAYLHAHPEDDDAGPTISFHTTFPSEGRYRLFLDFSHDGAVHTAEFTVSVGEAARVAAPAAPAGSAPPAEGQEHGHDH